MLILDRCRTSELPRGHDRVSEDVEAFFGRLLSADYATARSPLKVNESGLALCRELIDEERQSNPAAFDKVLGILGFDRSLFTNLHPAPLSKQS